MSETFQHLLLTLTIGAIVFGVVFIALVILAAFAVREWRDRQGQWAGRKRGPRNSH